jgi:uncharacterized protein (TIGR02246 family)
LLECFIARRDESAFEALLRRHGPMVLGVCRRVLANEADAEDAFQATFLVLLRKADSIKPRAMVGNWLYGVAHRTALKAREANARRRAREREVALPGAEASAGDRHHLQALLDRELRGLPEEYRAAIVLCDLEGRTRKEAARQLGWPEGTVASRVSRARALLARRLARHGLVLSAGALAAALAEGAVPAQVPAPLVLATLRAGTAARVAALTEGGPRVLLPSRRTTALVAFLAVAVVGVGAAALSRQPSSSAPATAPEGARPAKPGEREAIRKVIAAGVAALNKHDDKAFAAVFHPDADFGHVAGWRGRGRKGILLAHLRFFQKGGPKPGGISYQKAVVRAAEPHIRFLRADVATVDVPWTLTGVTGSDGKVRPAEKGLAMLVLTREKGSWGVASYRLAFLPETPATGR